VPPKNVAPDPKVVDPKKADPVEPKKVGPVEPKKIDPVEPKKVDMTDPKVGGPKPEDLAPLPGNEEVGKIESTNVIVLTRQPEGVAKWTRLDPAGRNAIRANDPVVALPGYKADIKLTSGVQVHLWGNLPEQVLVKPPLMESRVRFHPAAGGLDADLTLDAGRIYLTAGKPAGAKVRLHIGTEVWDVQLRDEKSEVMVQLSTAFIPGTTFARTGGEKPKSEVHLVVLRGMIDFNAPARFKKFDGMNAWTEVTWDSKQGQLSDPHAAPKDDLAASKIPSIEAEYGKAVQKTLSDARKDLSNPEGVRVLLKERLVMDPTDRLRPGMSGAEIVMILFPTQWAAYAQAAIMDGADSGELLKDILDLLRNESRSYVRQAAIVALSNWIARSPENTDLLVKGMVEKNWLPEVAEQFAQLMRGYSSADMKDPIAAKTGLDKLVELLDDPHLAIREAALANLLAFYAGPETGMNRILTSTDMANREANRAGANEAKLKAWDAFLKAWKENAEAIKRRMADKK